VFDSRQGFCNPPAPTTHNLDRPRPRSGRVFDPHHGFCNLPPLTIWTVQKVEAQSGRTVKGREESNTKPVVCSNRVQCSESGRVSAPKKKPRDLRLIECARATTAACVRTRGSLSRSLARCAQETALACATIVSSSRSRATHHSHTRDIKVLAGWLCATFGSSAFRTQENKQTNKHLQRRDWRGFVLWPNFTLWGWGTNSRLFLLHSSFSVFRFVCVMDF
jgi:hypothetical protein